MFMVKLYELNTLHGVNSTRSQSVKFNVMSQDRSKCLLMANVLVIDDIPVDIPLVDMTKYPHLEGLRTNADVVEDVLIGQDHAAALRPLAIHSGEKYEHFATLTQLGCLNGPVRVDAINRRIITYFISTTRKYCDGPFPNNNMLATSRLIPPIMSQEKKNEYSIYNTKVKPSIKNDHSEPVSDISEQSQQKLCYLPHHCIPVKTDNIGLLF